MKNTIVILLYKLFELEISLEEFYGNLSQNDNAVNNNALKNVAGVLAAEEKKHVDLYRRFVKETELKEEFVIKDDIMGQIDYILINLKQSINGYGILTAGQLIAKAIDNENKQIFLTTQITDLIKNETPPSFVNEIFAFLLGEEQQHLANLIPFNKM
ncbi:MAG: hypothetical protein WCD89_17195 [Anaerocolumna sp.]